MAADDRAGWFKWIGADRIISLIIGIAAVVCASQGYWRAAVAIVAAYIAGGTSFAIYDDAQRERTDG
jgi:hypothetical protein